MKSILQKPWILLAILMVFSLAASPLIKSRTASSQASGPRLVQNSSLQSAQDVYWVEVIVLNISDINLTAGTYSMDFYIMFTCENAPCTYEPTWDILNTTGEFSAADQGVSVPFEYYEYRVKADMIGKVDYSFYPFDYMYIEIFVEDKEHNANQLTYQFQNVDVDEILFNPSGWFHRSEYDGGYTYQANYGDANIVYDRLDVWLFLERDWSGAFMKTIFAAIVIVMIGMLSFLMKADATTERLALTSSTLVAIVLYHISLVSGVPATGYLTFTDKFMVWTYLIVFISLVISVLMMVHVNGGHTDKAERLHARTRWLIPLLWVLIMAFVFVKDLIIPYNILIASNEGAPWWPQTLEWLANWLDYAKYLPDGYFQ
ncbi:MAG: hypothetical protein AB1649_07290 [Chloroflexota bacterium]